MSRYVLYTTESGNAPFLEWSDSLDEKKRDAVSLYVERVAAGGSRKNVKCLGDGIWEIKIHYNQGAVRVYFCKINGIMVLLDGSKSNQKADIRQARRYWQDYQEREHG